MVILSMLPVGLLQAWASIEHGTWYARSAEFMQSGTMQTLRWMRVPGDILFAIGAALFAWFVLGLLTGHSFDDKVRLQAEALGPNSKEKSTKSPWRAAERIADNCAASPIASPVRDART